MQKLRDIVSDLSLDAKVLNIDDRISFRYLANKFRDKLSYFLRLEARSREFTKDRSIWKSLKCIELEQVATNACGFIDSCNTLSRSKKKIPEAYNTNYGLLLKIYVIDKSRELKVIISGSYKNYVIGEYLKENLYYWIEDGYLYVPNTDIESLTGIIIAKDPSQIDLFNNDCNCAYPLDSQLNYSDYLISLAKTEVMKEIVNGYKRINSDEKGDDNNNMK